MAASLLEPLMAAFRELPGRAPCLAVVKATDDPGAGWYADSQAKHCARYGIAFRLAGDGLGPASAEAEIMSAVREADEDGAVDGIIALRPFPPGVDAGAVATAIAPAKDAEGTHPANLGRLVLDGVDWESMDPPPPVGPYGFFPVPCTAMAVAALIRSVWPSLAGKRALVIGRSAIVGKPLSLLLTGLDATVTVAHTRSPCLPELARQADVLVAAAGASGVVWRRHRRATDAARRQGAPCPETPDLSPLVKGDWIKDGALVVDVGENEIPARLDGRGRPLSEPDGAFKLRRVGDVDREGVSARAGWLSAAQGGVGPLTNAFLLRNVILAAVLKKGHP